MKLISNVSHKLAFGLKRKLSRLKDRKRVNIDLILTLLRSFNPAALAQSKCQILRHGRYGQSLLFFILLLISLAGLEAKIVETDRMDDILQEVDDDTIVFFDIDDTLVYIPTMMGCSRWWAHCDKLFKSKQWDLLKVSSQLFPNLHQAALLVQSELVEERAPLIIEELKKRGVMVFGLTARAREVFNNPTFDKTTKRELARLGINFSKPKVDLPFESGGIIYTSSQLKGPFLETFLLKLKKKNKKVVFIDDNWRQIYSVDVQMASLKIPTVCFRYSKMDQHGKNFNPLVANIQLKGALEAQIILTNEQALEIADHLEDEDPNFYLHHLYENGFAAEARIK